MSQWKRPQSQPVQELYETEKHASSVFTPPTIAHSFFQPAQEQWERTTDQLGYTPQPEVNTDQLMVQPEKGNTTQDLKGPRVTVNLRGVGATRVLSNSEQGLSTALAGTLTATAAARATVVIPGKRRSQSHQSQKEGAEALSSRRMHPRLRYGLVMGAMVGIIGLILVTLTPLKSDQAQVPVLSNVVRWIQIQQIAWNVGSHSDQGQATSSNQQATSGNAGPPITILPMSQYVAIARQAALNAGISPAYFVNQINAESSFNPYAISPVGAVGIAQFMPSTAADLGINPYDPVQALNGAARHMAELSRTYGGNYAKALAAYNAGPGTVDYAIQQGGINWMNYLPYETRQYIYKIMGI